MTERESDAGKIDRSVDRRPGEMWEGDSGGQGAILKV